MVHRDMHESHRLNLVGGLPVLESWDNWILNDMQGNARRVFGWDTKGGSTTGLVSGRGG